MPASILATKLYLPRLRPEVVSRPRLIERLNEGLRRNLILISAPAGFGKTTLVAEWVAGCQRPVAWLSLDEGDNDPIRFLTYLVAALQAIAPTIGEGVLSALQSPQPPSSESILTTLLNDLTLIPGHFVLVLDDYHVLDARAVDQALTFLLEHLPQHMHLVIATREDPPLPLARLRARSQLAELRARDLRFTSSEAAAFLNQVMGLHLSAEDIAALEARTEGWIAGLQLAALSMQGHQDAVGFITSFTGSHHFVMDYLVEEVLGQQSERVQTFLLRTSVLDRLSGPLCDAVLLAPPGSGQETLAYLERANLFLIPLDDERRWYRYHHLFAELLQQRLRQSLASSPAEAESQVNELHIRASQWYEDHGLDIEAFRHATAAGDIARAERLIDGKGIPLHFRGALITILNWLDSLPEAVLNARPSLWMRYAGLLLMNGQTTGVEEKLQAAEAALQGAELNDRTRNFIGQIASARATVALTRYQPDIMIAQSHRALEYLHPRNLSSRATANWALGTAYMYQGDRVAARRAYTEGVSLSQAARDAFTAILTTIGLGLVQEADNELYLAVETYQSVLQLAGDQPLQIVSEAYLGLARIFYEWNDLDAAEQHVQQGLHLSRQYERIIDRFILYELFLARLKLARGDVAGAAALLAEAAQTARQKNFVYRIPDVVAVQVLVLLRQGNLAAAAHLAQAHELPQGQIYTSLEQAHGLSVSQARVYLAQGDPSTALAVLEQWRHQVEAKGWHDERLRVMVLQAIALQAQGEQDRAVQLLLEALALAEPGGFIRLFIDEGLPIAQLLSKAAAHGMMPDYIEKLLAACEAEGLMSEGTSSRAPAQPLLEPLSQRELEILRLVAQGLSNQEISERLFLALDTVKGHNRKIFSKLQVERRTEAVARARELGLL